MIVEFKPRKGSHRLTIQRSRPTCPHTAMKVHPDTRTVTCDECGDDLDPIEALIVIAKKIWWEESRLERELEHEERRVKKVQYAAIAHLHRAGITPEKYAERWAKEEAHAKEAEAKLEMMAPAKEEQPKGAA